MSSRRSTRSHNNDTPLQISRDRRSNSKQESSSSPSINEDSLIKRHTRAAAAKAAVAISSSHPTPRKFNLLNDENRLPPSSSHSSHQSRKRGITPQKKYIKDISEDEKTPHLSSRRILRARRSEPVEHGSEREGDDDSDVEREEEESEDDKTNNIEDDEEEEEEEVEPRKSYSFRDRDKSRRSLSNPTEVSTKEGYYRTDDDNNEGYESSTSDNTANEVKKQYSFRDREKITRKITNISNVSTGVNNRGRDAYYNHGRRSKHNRGNRHHRRHYDSSSDSDDSFERYESKRMHKEANSIQPINGSRGRGPALLDRATYRDIAKADANPITIDNEVTWKQIGGLEDHITALKEMVLLPLLYPEIFSKYDCKPPRGVLFYGPPGCGKTLVARALANSCTFGGQQVAFFMRKGADCLSKWVGEAERQLRLLFEQARLHQPSIIFFDEIDGLAPVRSAKQDQIHASIVSTLLALMDGLDDRGQVIVIGATNRLDNIDPALRRPGRFDRELLFKLPSQKDRRAILDIHTNKWNPPLTAQFKNDLAEACVGYCGADLKSLCAEASLMAVRRRYPQIYESNNKLVIDTAQIKVLRKDFATAFNRIIPASRRAAIVMSKPLAVTLEPLLGRQFRKLIVHLENTFPLKVIRNQQTENEDEEDEMADIKAIYGVLNTDKCSKCNKPGDLICCDTCPSAFHLECTNNRIIDLSSDDPWFCDHCIDLHNGHIDFPSQPSSLSRFRPEAFMFVYKSRLLIHGDGDIGQKQLGSAILHYLEELPAFSIDFPSLSMDNSNSMEVALMNRLSEARKIVPCVIYLPSCESWWSLASETMKVTLIEVINGISSELPILTLFTSDSVASSIPDDLLSLFSPSQQFSLTQFSEDDLKNYFSFIPDQVLKFPSVDFVAIQRGLKKKPHASGKREKLPIAPIPKKPEVEAVKTIEDEHALRELRIFMRAVIYELEKESKFRPFVTLVDREEVPDYYEVINEPMALDTMREKIDEEEYCSLSMFLEDLNLIVRNCQEYNPRDARGKQLIHNAKNMRDTVLSMIHRFREKVGYDLIEKCEEIAKSKGANISKKDKLVKNQETLTERKSSRLRGETVLLELPIISRKRRKVEKEDNVEEEEEEEEEVVPRVENEVEVVVYDNQSEEEEKEEEEKEEVIIDEATMNALKLEQKEIHTQVARKTTILLDKIVPVCKSKRWNLSSLESVRVALQRVIIGHDKDQKERINMVDTLIEKFNSLSMKL